MHVRRDRQRREAGQATVEFVLVAIMLAFVMVLAWQMTWVACQKWYFNFTAAYAARAWAVQPSDQYSPQEILFKVQSAALLRSDSLRKMPLVKLIMADDANASAGATDDDDRFGTGYLPEGIRYEGLGYYMRWFQPSTIESAGFETNAFATGGIIFETYIPIDHEDVFGVENPDLYDNDCSFPCTDNVR